MIVSEQRERSKRINRDAFLYLDSKGNKKNFAQCGSCTMFTGSTCTILGPDVKITTEMSCGFYVPGTPDTSMKGKEIASVTPKEAGLVDRQVRCENCVHVDLDESKCYLFEKLNSSNPSLFSLDTNIDAQGCCNAQTPKP
jgi:hypothetical protein